MKAKLKLKDKNKIIEKEVVLKGTDHLIAQMKYPSTKQEDKRFKKPKYKNKEINNYEN